MTGIWRLPGGVQQGGMVARLAGLLGIAPGCVYCVVTTRTTFPCWRNRHPLRPRQLCPGGTKLGGPDLVPCQEGVIGDIVEILDKLY